MLDYRAPRRCGFRLLVGLRLPSCFPCQSRKTLSRCRMRWKNSIRVSWSRTPMKSRYAMIWSDGRPPSPAEDTGRPALNFANADQTGRRSGKSSGSLSRIATRSPRLRSPSSRSRFPPTARFHLRNSVSFPRLPPRPADGRSLGPARTPAPSGRSRGTWSSLPLPSQRRT